MAQQLSISRMQQADVPFAIDLAAEEGWNPGLSDADCFYQADPGGFFIGRFDSEPVGCISAVKYQDNFGFIGLYIVRPEYRGRGMGKRIWDTALARLQGCPMGLDGVPAQQDNYRQSGFHTAYRNLRFAGQGGGELPADVIPLHAVPFDSLQRFDRRCFPSRRDIFLQAWITQQNAHGYAVPGTHDLRGWGLIRRCREGWKIGPLFADDAHVAATLFQAFAFHAASDTLYLDAPEPNGAALALAETQNMSVMFETARMYAGPAPEIDLNAVFGVTSFELG